MYTCNQCNASHYMLMYDYNDTPDPGPLFSSIVVINGDTTQFVNTYDGDGPYEFVPTFMICLACGNDETFTSRHDGITLPYYSPFGASQKPLHHNDYTSRLT